MTKQDIINHLKPLEWDKDAKGNYYAYSMLQSKYWIAPMADSFNCGLNIKDETEWDDYQDSIEGAKMLCQQDYEETIISCFNI